MSAAADPGNAMAIVLVHAPVYCSKFGDVFRSQAASNPGRVSDERASSSVKIVPDLDML